MEKDRAHTARTQGEGRILPSPVRPRLSSHCQPNQELLARHLTEVVHTGPPPGDRAGEAAARKDLGRQMKTVNTLSCTGATEMGYIGSAMASALPNAKKSQDNSVQGLKGDTESSRCVQP